MSGEAADVGGGSAKKEERRQEPRLPLQLKVAIVYHEHADAATRPSYHGQTNDISLHGLSVLVPDNVFNHGEVTVLLAIPPARVGDPQKIIEATAKMVYTVFSSEHDTFRIGLTFSKFKGDARGLLKAFITECNVLLNRS